FKLMAKFQQAMPAEPKISSEKRLEVAALGRVLLINRLGGVGDILCARLIFEDLKRMPNIGDTAFAVPRRYLPVIEDHPYIDCKIAVEDLENVTDYVISKDITEVCDKLERWTRGNINQNRADIYADSIGLKLKNHNGHLSFTDREMEFAKVFMRQLGKGKKVGIAPFTSHASKDLGKQLARDLVFWCRRRKAMPLVFHDEKISIEEAEVVSGLPLRQWMAVVSLLDAVVTASTAMFWVAQLTRRPTVVIAGYEDARVFGKYHPDLAIVQRCARGERKLIARQEKEIEKFNGDWSHCPCWSAQRCAFRKWREYPLFCLDSIRIDEVVKPLARILRRRKAKGVNFG
ncbi:unnamed protein product, partial [marine sediment metagenome]